MMVFDQVRDLANVLNEIIVESVFTAERINSQLDLKKSLLSAMSARWCLLAVATRSTASSSGRLVPTKWRHHDPAFHC